MELVKVCTICLNNNVKMYKLEGNLLSNYYKHVINGLDTKNISELMQYACYECVYYIQKYSAFREKCIRGHSVLLQIYEKNGMVTENGLKAIDRLELGLCSNLKLNEPISFDVCHEIEHIEIELEPCTYHISDVDDIGTSVEFDNVKSENDIKVEGGDPISDFTDDQHCTEEPVSERDALKIPNSFTKKTKRKNKDATNIEMKQSKRRRVLKCKPSREPGMINNVTVVKLSVEEQLEEVTKRQHSSNYLNAAFKCQLCYKGFLDPDAFDRHAKKHDPSSGPFKCPICKHCFPKSTVLKKHITMHEKNYICKTCSYTCKRLHEAKQHQDEHKGQVYNCEHCGNLSTKLSSHLTHLRINHPSEFVCDVCGYAFVSKAGLTRHRITMHKNCDEQIANGNKYFFHLRRKHPDKQYPNVKKNICDICGKSFKCNAVLLYHRRTHAEDPPHKCSQCPKAFFNRLDLLKHEKNHSDDRPFACETCSKAFKTKGALSRHLLCHTGEKPYECNVCGKTFSQSNSRNLHVKTVHLKEPAPYVSRTRLNKRRPAQAAPSAEHSDNSVY